MCFACFALGLLQLELSVENLQYGTHYLNFVLHDYKYGLGIIYLCFFLLHSFEYVTVSSCR